MKNNQKPLPEITPANVQDEKIAEAVEAYRKRKKQLHNEGFAADMEDMQNEKGLYLILTRFSDASEWDYISNPRWDISTLAQKTILTNAANDYAEYQNCGCVYRMIRFKDRAKYIGETFIPKSAKLNSNKPHWKRK